MATSPSYRDIIKQSNLKYAAFRPSHGDIRLDPLFDETNQRYALVQVGWDRGRRVRGLLLYVSVDEDKVCIEYDGMEHGISDDLIRQGVAEENIVLAYCQASVVSG